MNESDSRKNIEKLNCHDKFCINQTLESEETGLDDMRRSRGAVHAV